MIGLLGIGPIATPHLHFVLALPWAFPWRACIALYTLVAVSLYSCPFFLRFHLALLCWPCICVTANQSVGLNVRVSSTGPPRSIPSIVLWLTSFLKGASITRLGITCLVSSLRIGTAFAFSHAMVHFALLSIGLCLLGITSLGLVAPGRIACVALGLITVWPSVWRRCAFLRLCHLGAYTLCLVSLSLPLH